MTDIIHDTLLANNQEALNDQKRLTKELAQIGEQINTLERRFVLLNEITKSQYDLFMPELKAKQRELEMKLENGGINSSNLKKSVIMALDYACNLPYLWKLGDLETKRAIQYMVFPDGIEYDFVGNYKSIRDAQKAGRRYATDLMHNSMSREQLAFK